MEGVGREKERAVVLRRYGNSFEAEVVKGLLAEHGISALVRDKHWFGGLGLGGSAVVRDVDLLVLECDAEEAERVIRKNESSNENKE